MAHLSFVVAWPFVACANQHYLRRVHAQGSRDLRIVVVRWHGWVPVVQPVDHLGAGLKEAAPWRALLFCRTGFAHGSSPSARRTTRSNSSTVHCRRFG